MWAATEAKALGHGGIALVERATGISRSTIQRGLRELDGGVSLAPGRTRRAGGGRKRAITKDSTLLADLDGLLFSHIAMNWRGKPLTSLGVIVSLIGSTRSETGLRVRSEVDRGAYPGGVVITDEQM